MSDKILNISDDSFKNDVLESSTPVLVDFWAPWCGPCKAISPVLEEIAEEYAGKITIAKMNIDENELTPAKFGVRSIPTLILFKDGQTQDTQIGSVSKTQLTEFIDKNL